MDDVDTVKVSHQILGRQTAAAKAAAKLPTRVPLRGDWPLLPDDRYFGPITGVYPCKSPFPPRSRETDDWKLYVHVCLERGDNPIAQKHLEEWCERHGGQFPVVFVPIPFRTRRGTWVPLAPHLKDKMRKLAGHALAAGLTEARRILIGEDFNFELLIGLYALVQVKTCTRDQDGDDVGRPNYYSLGKKILGLKRVEQPKPFTSDLEPLTENPQPTTHDPFQHPEDLGDGA